MIGLQHTDYFTGRCWTYTTPHQYTSIQIRPDAQLHERPRCPACCYTWMIISQRVDAINTSTQCTPTNLNSLGPSRIGMIHRQYWVPLAPWWSRNNKQGKDRSKMWKLSCDEGTPESCAVAKFGYSFFAGSSGCYGTSRLRHPVRDFKEEAGISKKLFITLQIKSSDSPRVADMCNGG